MSKLKMFILFLFLSILLTSCQQEHKFTTLAYETKIESKRIDKKVNMKYFNEKQEGQMEIEFEEKSIPFEFKLMEDTFEGTFRLSGSFEEGEISVLLLSPDERIEWKKVYKFGQLNVEELFALYGSDNYILRIEFFNAKKGKLKIYVTIY